ncbi:MAG: hypothetical protein FD133_1097 [Erysipelotrichaceae bacterium]|nr:MAG: hypothetical protein FD179_459 [Erysipelotrichaceae bacterium]TXT18087.1 MAG: hypothetical protein FD133_1097 [Erysipelotrichaceae bacterium]
MNQTPKLPENIDEYIALFPSDLQTRMQELRKLIRETAPESNERMAYQMPTFYYYGNLVHFACFTHHIGFFPGSSGVEHFLPELKGLKTSKGTIQIPHKMDLPLELIKRIVEFRILENAQEGQLKKKKKNV